MPRSQWPPSHARLCRFVTISSLLVPALALGQGAGTMRGRVIDRATSKPVADARITLLTDRRSVTADSSGRYLFTALPPGVLRFAVEAVPYSTLQLIVELSTNQDLERVIELDSMSAQKLLPVTVKASEVVNHRLDAFNRRRATGRGQYLTREEIERNGSESLMDAVRAMRGVTAECYGSGCVLRMARAPMRCLPDYIVDERVDNQFGPTTPIRDIDAVEVYSGPSDVPGEYAGRNAGCGVIVIWTRTGPPPKPKERVRREPAPRVIQDPLAGDDDLASASA